jgi:hypothetical protein
MQDYQAVCPPEAEACPQFIPCNLEVQGKGVVFKSLVIEPLGKGMYVWRLCEKKGLSKVQPVEENKKKRKWKLDLDGWEIEVSKPFLDSLPYQTPRTEVIEKWVKGELESKPVGELFKAVERFIMLILDLEEPYEIKMIALAVFQTWLRRRLRWAFNIDISGPFGSGKTTALEALAELCYHAVLGTTSPAALGRMNEKYDVTWIIDEYDKAKKADEGLIDMFMRQGYRDGVRIFRFNKDTGKEESFNPFGPKFISYYEHMETALKQRSLTHIKMSRSLDYRLPIINFVRNHLSQPLLEELFLWYMDSIGQLNLLDLPDFSKGVENIDILDMLNPTIPTHSPYTLTPQKIESIEQIRSTLRQRFYEAVTKNLSEEEKGLLKLFQARGAELGFLAVTIARLLGIEIVKELKEALEVKTLEEEEPEYEPVQVVKQVLARIIYDEGLEEAPQTYVFKEAKAALQAEYGFNLSSKRFGMILRDLGFRERKNIRRRGRKGERILVFDQIIKMKIPPTEMETAKTVVETMLGRQAMRIEITPAKDRLIKLLRGKFRLI